MEQDEIERVTKELQEMKQQLEFAQSLPYYYPGRPILQKERKIFEDIKRLQSPRFVDPLIEILKLPLLHSPIEIKILVEDSLAAIGKPAVSPLLLLLDTKHAYDAANALERIGDAAALIPVLERVSKDKNLLVPAIMMCGRFGGRDSIDFLNILIIAFRPFSFPVSLLKRKENQARKAITNLARDALESIRARR